MRCTPNWSDEQLATLKRMFAEGHTDEVIGRAVGRSASAVSVKRFGLKLNRLTKLAGRLSPVPVRAPSVMPPEPRSLTAEIFGDPQPGRSALDKMRAG